jgi:hypothetical protein
MLQINACRVSQLGELMILSAANNNREVPATSSMCFLMGAAELICA